MVKMSDPNIEFPSSDFSVISHPPESSMVNGLFLPPHLQLSTHSSSNEPSLDDFKKQLQDLLQENTELKGALQQNTSIMREHFSTLANWQEKVGAATQRHKRILEEMHGEKQTLLARLEQSAHKLDATQQELDKTKRESEASLRTAQEVAEVLRREVDRQKKEMLMEEPRSSPPLLYVDDDCGYTVVHHLPGGGAGPAVEPQRSALLQLQEEQERSSGLTQQLAEEQTKSAQLQKELERSKSMFLESDLDKAASSLKSYKDRCRTMDEWLGEIQGKLELLAVAGSGDSGNRLLEELRILRSTLAQEQKNREDDRRNLQQVKEKFEELQRDHEHLLHKWKNSQSEGRQTEVLREIEKRQQQEQSDSLTAQLVVAREELSAAKRELEQLTSQSHMLQHDSEQVPILRAQVEIYQQDFEVECQGKERLQGDLDKARLEITSLQQQNAQLVDELNDSQQQMTNPSSHHHQSSSSRRRSRHHLPNAIATLVEPGARNLREYVQLEPCPKCQCVFSSVDALENHIDRCLLEEGSSPYP